MAWGWRWLVVAAVWLGATGCVNNYVYGEGGSASTTSAGSDETQASATTTRGSGASTGASGGGSSSTGVSTSGGGGAMPSSSGSTMGAETGAGGDSPTTGGGDSPTTGGGDSLELCQGPCAADEACGAAADLCVELTRAAEPVCLRSCGRGCPVGFSCTERTSLGGVSGLQCGPDGNRCG